VKLHKDTKNYSAKFLRFYADRFREMADEAKAKANYLEKKAVLYDKAAKKKENQK
jgi:hypothetical protein